MEETLHVEFLVSGLVQGVGFRYFVWRNALAMELTGFVKNLYSGDVYAVVEGTKENIDSFHQQLLKGPARSRIDVVKVQYNEVTNSFNDFEII